MRLQSLRIHKNMTQEELIKGESSVKSPTKVDSKNYTYSMCFLCLGIILLLVLLFLFGIPNLLLAFFFSLPLFLCSLVCFLFQKNLLLWCSWTLYFISDNYFRYATDINWKYIFYTFYLESDNNYSRIFIGWIQFILLLFLICYTVSKFKNVHYPITPNSKLRILMTFIIPILLQVSMLISTKLMLYLLPISNRNSQNSNGIFQIIKFAFLILDWSSIFIFTYALVSTVRYKLSAKNTTNLE